MEGQFDASTNSLSGGVVLSLLMQKAFCTLYGGLLGILATVGTSYRSCSKYQNPNWVMLLLADPQLGYISGGELQFHKNGACDW